MAAISSAQAGNWSDTATWTGGVVPANGDTTTLTHAVVVDVNTTVGTSPGGGGAGTAAVAIGAGGKLTVNAGVTFICRGDYRLTGGSTFTPRDILDIRGTFEFDSSQAAAPSTTNYQLITGSAHFQQAKVRIIGTEGARAALRANAAGAFAVFSTGGFLDSGFLHAEYTDFTLFGDASNPMMAPSLRNTTDAEFTVNRCIFDTCGNIALGLPDANCVIDLSYTTWKNSLATTNITGTAGLNAPGGGITRRMRGCVFDKIANLYFARGMTIGWVTARTDDEDWCIFDGGIQTAAASLPTSIQGVFIREPTGQTVATLPQGTSIKDFYLLNDYGGVDPHFISHLVDSGVATNTIDRGVFETSGSNGAAGNGILTASPASAWTTNVRRVIVVPDDGGSASANLVHQFSSNTNHTVDIQFCTAHADGDGGGVNATSDNARIAALKNCIFWDSAAGDYKLTTTGTASAADTITGGGANVDFNCGFNLLAGSEGKGYNIAGFTVAPGANDIDEDPDFVDSARKLAPWDTSLGGAGTRANARAEMMKKNESTFNSAYTVRALLTYVENGFAPQNQNLAGAASDGSDIGAVAVAAVSSSGSSAAVRRRRTRMAA